MANAEHKAAQLYHLSLTAAQVQELINLLAETAMEMDDDGRNGAFRASPLHAIYSKILALRTLTKAV